MDTRLRSESKNKQSADIEFRLFPNKQVVRLYIDCDYSELFLIIHPSGYVFPAVQESGFKDVLRLTFRSTRINKIGIRVRSTPRISHEKL